MGVWFWQDGDSGLWRDPTASSRKSRRFVSSLLSKGRHLLIQRYFCAICDYATDLINESEYMEIHIFALRKKQWINDWSSQLYTQLKQLLRLSFRNCLSCVYNCDDQSFIHCFFRSSNICIFISSPQRVYNEFTQWPAPSWLDSSIGRTLHRYRRGHGFESRSSLNFFQAFFSQLLKLRK